MRNSRALMETLPLAKERRTTKTRKGAISKVQLQRKLDHPRIGNCAVDHAKAGTVRNVSVWVIENGVIEGVEEFCAEFDSPVLVRSQRE